MIFKVPEDQWLHLKNPNLVSYIILRKPCTVEEEVVVIRRKREPAEGWWEVEIWKGEQKHTSEDTKLSKGRPPFECHLKMLM